MKLRERASHWAAELIDVAAVFFAVGTAHLFVTLVGERAHGPQMLVASAGILIGGALLRQRWKRRPHRTRHAALPDLLAIPAARQELMRVRTTLPDRPGTLAALSTRLAECGVNILAIQIHPTEHGAVDDLLVAVPRHLSPGEVGEAVGGGNTEVNRADAHDLVDPATRALTVARHTAAGVTSLDDAMHHLLGADLATTRPPAPAHVAVLHGAEGQDRSSYGVRPPSPRPRSPGRRPFSI